MGKIIRFRFGFIPPKQDTLNNQQKRVEVSNWIISEIRATYSHHGLVRWVKHEMRARACVLFGYL